MGCETERNANFKELCRNLRKNLIKVSFVHIPFFIGLPG